MKSNIKFLVMDVDGTLTDGKIYMSDYGELFKAFNIKDGYGIHNLLPLYNIIPIIITARSSKIVENRCNELDITEIHQGCNRKLDKLNAILSNYSTKNGFKYSLKNVAYIGDDEVDLECMEHIKKAGGIVGCPANSIDKVIKVADYMSKYNGGDGAVRDFIEHLIL